MQRDFEAQLLAQQQAWAAQQQAQQQAWAAERERMQQDLRQTQEASQQNQMQLALAFQFMPFQFMQTLGSQMGLSPPQFTQTNIHVRVATPTPVSDFTTF